jgi:pimeloyl-ACP methyl ester carboxylesterase
VTHARPAIVRAPDGASIAVWDLDGEGDPVVLVHGAAADHTTWRVSGPLLAERWRVFAVDRRGRGASGDGASYAIEREYEDLAAVVDGLAADRGRPVDLVGHSFGGRVALGAALLSENLGRLVVYEGAPAGEVGGYLHDAIRDRLAAHLAAGDNEGLLTTFMRDVVGMPESDLAAYRADPIWPRRVAAAHTILREVDAERADEATVAAVARMSVPVLQIVGGASRPTFLAAARSLDARLADGRIIVIPGARHAAHHTHAPEFVAAILAFLGEPT